MPYPPLIFHAFQSDPLTAEASDCRRHRYVLCLKDMSHTRSQTFRAAAWSLSAVGFWVIAGWLGHLTSPLAIDLTDPAFALALVWTYVAAWAVTAIYARERRIVIFRFAAVLLSLLLSLIILEVPAGFGLVDYSQLRVALTGAWNGPQSEFLRDHEFSFRRPANAHWSGRPRSNMAEYFNLPIRASYEQKFSTDSHGFRNLAEFEHSDIALVGDSYIEGAYVSDEETVAVRLHDLTGRDVANLGVSGYGTEQELKVIERYVLPLKPRMLAWFFFEGNDLDDDQAFDNSMAYERGVRSPSPPASIHWREFVKRSFTKNAFMELRQWSDGLIPNGIDSFGWFRDADGETRRLYFFDFYAKRALGTYEQQRLEITEATLQRGAEMAREHGITLLVYYIPIKFRVYGDLCTYPPGSPCPRWHPWDLETRLAAFCQQAGIRFVSLTAPMRKAASAGEVIYAPEDSHWNAAGHLFVAKQVAAEWALTASTALAH
jgi:hypothetical protein